MGIQTYVPLANVTLAATQATVTFSSISQAYRDLVLVSVPALSSGTGGIAARFNLDSGSNYTYTYMYGNGTATGSGYGAQTSISMVWWADLNTTVGSVISVLNIMDYSATDKHKSTIARDGNAGVGTSAITNRWANTAAISSIQLFSGSGSFAAGSSFALYGIGA